MTVPQLVPAARSAAAAAGVGELVVLGEADGATPILDLLATGARAPRPGPDLDPATAVGLLPYSSGTTGLPKGVLLTHANLVTSVRQVGSGLRVGERDTLLAVPPFSHIMGFLVTLAVPLCSGATVVTMPRFDPGQFLELLQRHRVTVLVGAPPMLQVLTPPPAGRRGRPRLAGAGWCAAGRRCTADAQRALSARLPGATVGQAWGLTETTVGLSMPDRDAGSVPGTVGRVMPNTELRVVDPGTGRDLAAGQPGELLARGPQVMAGYLHRPEATAAMVDPDGWLRTGDLGLVDGEGNVVIVDRLKELIKVQRLPGRPGRAGGAAGHPPGGRRRRRPAPPRPRPAARSRWRWSCPGPAPSPTPTSCSPGWPSGWRRTSGSAPSASPTPSPGRPRASCCAGPWPTRTGASSDRGRTRLPIRGGLANWANVRWWRPRCRPRRGPRAGPYCSLRN